MSGAALIWTTLPDGDNARKIAKVLLDERLVACANIMAEHHAIFVWQGTMDEATEVGMLLKLDATRLDAAMARLTELHPYDVPAIVGWPCNAAAPTLAWLEGTVA